VNLPLKKSATELIYSDVSPVLSRKFDILNWIIIYIYKLWAVILLKMRIYIYIVCMCYYISEFMIKSNWICLMYSVWHFFFAQRFKWKRVTLLHYSKCSLKKNLFSRYIYTEKYEKNKRKQKINMFSTMYIEK
jgi:hypothetical protein